MKTMTKLALAFWPRRRSLSNARHQFVGRKSALEYSRGLTKTHLRRTTPVSRATGNYRELVTIIVPTASASSNLKRRIREIYLAGWTRARLGGGLILVIYRRERPGP